MELQYLFNGPRYIARHPDVRVMCRTTSAEAVHGEHKRFAGQATVQQTKGMAILMTDLFCVKKPVTGYMQRLPLSSDYAPVDMLRLCANDVNKLDFKRDVGPIAKRSAAPVDVSSLPKGYKVSACRKGATRRGQ